MADNPKITQIKVGNTTYDVSDSTAVKKSGDIMTGDLYIGGGNLYLYDDIDYIPRRIELAPSGNVKLSCPDNDTLVATVYGGNGGFEVTYSGNEIYLAPTNYVGNQIWSKLSDNNYISRFTLPDVNAEETLATREWVTDNVSIRIYDYTDF